MTHYYLYIKAGAQLDAESRFYKVAIGDGVLGRKQLAWLEAYAFEHGHFFVIWGLDAAAFYTKCVRSIGLDSTSIIAIPGRDLISSLKCGCEDPAFLEACTSRHRLLMAIDPHYYAYYQLSKR